MSFMDPITISRLGLIRQQQILESAANDCCSPPLWLMVAKGLHHLAARISRRTIAHKVKPAFAGPYELVLMKEPCCARCG